MRSPIIPAVTLVVAVAGCSGSPSPAPTGSTQPGAPTAPTAPATPTTPPAPGTGGGGTGGGTGGGGVPAPTVDGPAWFIQAGPFSPAAVAVGATASAVIRVYDVSKKTDLTLTSLTLEGADRADFALDPATSAAALSTSLPPNQGASVAFTVTVTPSAPGTRTASLVLVSNAGTQTVPLGGVGLAQQPVAVYPPDAIAFLSSSNAPVPVTISSGGAEVLVLSSIALAGADASVFTIVPVNRGTGNCYDGIPLPFGSQCVIGVSYRAGVVGPRSGDLVIATNDPGNARIDLPLTIAAP